MKDDKDFWTYLPPLDSSWYWRKLHALKASMANWYQNGSYCLTTNVQYSVSSNYNALPKT